MPRPTWVYLIRHGQSTFNADGRFQGCSDEPVLTAAGMATAMAAAGYLHDARLDAILSSALRRASQTALRIFLHLRRRVADGPCFRIDPRLREIELPQWEGRTITSVRDEFVEQYRAWRETPHLFRLAGQAPAVPALFARAAEFWDSLLDRFAGSNLLLVTHGGTARALISTAMGIAPERFHQMQQSNGGISLLEFNEGRARPARLHAMNAVDYLGQNLPKLKDTKTGLRVLMIPAGEAGGREHAARTLRNCRIHGLFADSAAHAAVASRLLDGAQAEVSKSIPNRCVAPGTLETVVWVVHPGLCQQVLAEFLGLTPAEHGRLAPVPYTFTVLHYPNPARAPILQAMNLHDSGRMQRVETHGAAGERFMWPSPRSSKE